MILRATLFFPESNYNLVKLQIITIHNGCICAFIIYIYIIYLIYIYTLYLIYIYNVCIMCLILLQD